MEYIRFVFGQEILRSVQIDKNFYRYIAALGCTVAVMDFLANYAKKEKVWGAINKI
jgi:hypothetical protein